MGGEPAAIGFGRDQQAGHIGAAGSQQVVAVPCWKLHLQNSRKVREHRGAAKKVIFRPKDDIAQTRDIVAARRGYRTGAIPEAMDKLSFIFRASDIAILVHDHSRAIRPESKVNHRHHHTDVPIRG